MTHAIYTRTRWWVLLCLLYFDSIASVDNFVRAECGPIRIEIFIYYIFDTLFCDDNACSRYIYVFIHISSDYIEHMIKSEPNMNV